MTSRRKPPAPEPPPTDGPAWLASISRSLGHALEEHERGGKHRTPPPDATVSMEDLALLGRLGRK